MIKYSVADLFWARNWDEFLSDYIDHPNVYDASAILFLITKYLFCEQNTYFSTNFRQSHIKVIICFLFTPNMCTYDTKKLNISIISWYFVSEN